MSFMEILETVGKATSKGRKVKQVKVKVCSVRKQIVLMCAHAVMAIWSSELMISISFFFFFFFGFHN